MNDLQVRSITVKQASKIMGKSDRVRADVVGSTARK